MSWFSFFQHECVAHCRADFCVPVGYQRIRGRTGAASQVRRLRHRRDAQAHYGEGHQGAQGMTERPVAFEQAHAYVGRMCVGSVPRSACQDHVK
jgi:hypothetical protein